MFCHYCGESLIESSTYCSHCGKKLDVKAELEIGTSMRLHSNPDSPSASIGPFVNSVKNSNTLDVKNIHASILFLLSVAALIISSRIGGVWGDSINIGAAILFFYSIYRGIRYLFKGGRSLAVHQDAAGRDKKFQPPQGVNVSATLEKNSVTPNEDAGKWKNEFNSPFYGAMVFIFVIGLVIAAVLTA